MKTLEYYLGLKYPMEITEDPDEGGYVISFPDLAGCLTCVDKFEDIIPMAEDAKRCWMEAVLEMGQTIPEPSYLEKYSGHFVLRIPKSLHRSLAEHAKKEGMSLNQYCSYLLATADAHYPAISENMPKESEKALEEKPKPKTA